MLDSGVFRQFSPINELKGQFLSDVLSHVRIITVQKGTMLFKRGKIVPDHYFLLDGEVDLINNEYEVERIKSATERAGKPLNTLSPTGVSAVAKTHVRYFKINIDVLARQLAYSKNPGLAQQAAGDGQDIGSFDLTGGPGILVGELSDGNDWMTCLLQSPLFTHISSSQLQELFNKFETVEVEAGEKLIKEGARGDYFYVLAAGTALVTNRSGSVDLELKEGNYFGEEALISDAPRNASVIMSSAGVVKRLNAADFAVLMREPVLKYVQWENLRGLSKPYKIIDVRLPLEFRSSHLPGSVNMPLSRLRENLKDLGHASLYVVSDEAGPRADIAAYILCEAGFDTVILKNAVQHQLSEVS